MLWEHAEQMKKTPENAFGFGAISKRNLSAWHYGNRNRQRRKKVMLLCGKFRIFTDNCMVKCLPLWKNNVRCIGSIWKATESDFSKNPIN